MRISCNSEDAADRLQQVDTTLVSTSLQRYKFLDPRAVPKMIYPQLAEIVGATTALDDRESLDAGSVAIEAAIGAPNAKIRRSMLCEADRRLAVPITVSNDHTAHQAAIKQQFGTLLHGLRDRRQLGEDYADAMLQDLSQFQQTYDTNLITARSLEEVSHIAGIITIQSVTCLIQDAANGLHAVPSMQRQQLSQVKVNGKKYRWDVTVESDGSTLPSGQYRLQVKGNPSYEDLDAYHPDVVVVSAPRDLGDNPYLKVKHQAAHAILAGDPAADGYTDNLLWLMEQHGPAVDETWYIH